MNTLKTLIFFLLGSFLISVATVSQGAVNPTPLATNSPYKNGINDSCGGCATGQICTSGICCNSGYSNCSGSCVNLQSNVNNCGSCGNVCNAGADICSSGTCVECEKDGDCKTGICCSSACVDDQTDMDNCGSCGNACDPKTETCTKGACG